MSKPVVYGLAALAAFAFVVASLAAIEIIRRRTGRDLVGAITSRVPVQPVTSVPAAAAQA